MTKKRKPPEPFPCLVEQCSEHGWRQYDPSKDLEQDPDDENKKRDSHIVFNHAMYMAPWVDSGVEYYPISPRTGRMVSQIVAEAEYNEMYGAVGSAGLWDHEEEARVRTAAGCRYPTAPERYDAHAMKVFAKHHSHEFTGRQLEVFVLFWVGKLSYGQIARQLDLSKKRIEQCVSELRARLAAHAAAKD